MAGRAIRVLAGVVLLAGILVMEQAAHAQTPPPLSSIDPKTFLDQPAGIRYGGLLYQATLKSGFIWDSNVFLNRQNALSDRIAYLSPGLAISTIDPNYRFRFLVDADHLELRSLGQRVAH
jgi:hypothetical protein